jgi:hypothetical protein
MSYSTSQIGPNPIRARNLRAERQSGARGLGPVARARLAWVLADPLEPIG